MMLPIRRALRLFSTSASTLKQARGIPGRPRPPADSDIEESYLKGSGPGGQKINKTNSAVQLKHIPTGIVVKSQATRSRSQNRKIARGILAQRIDDLENGINSRSAVLGGIAKKKADSAAKKSRRKYRRLQEEKEAAAATTSATANTPTTTDTHSQHPHEDDAHPTSCQPSSQNSTNDTFTNSNSHSKPDR